MGSRRVLPIFTADDLARTLDWYRDVLGWEVGETFEEEGALTGAPGSACSGRRKTL